MDLVSVRNFLMWCTILNGCLLVFWTVLVLSVPDLVYATQRRWFPLSREAFGAFMYGFLGFFKLVFIVFNLVPFLAMLIIS